MPKMRMDVPRIYWKYFVLIHSIVSVIVIIWFTIGGVIDLKSMLKLLSSMKRDENDDGFLGEHNQE